jgi:hypothetical protein
MRTTTQRATVTCHSCNTGTCICKCASWASPGLFLAFSWALPGLSLGFSCAVPGLFLGPPWAVEISSLAFPGESHNPNENEKLKNENTTHIALREPRALCAFLPHHAVGNLLQVIILMPIQVKEKVVLAQRREVE